MQALRSLALISFLLGAGMLVAGFIFRSGDAEDVERPTATTFDVIAPPTPTVTNTPPPVEGTVAPAPTPAPPPYDGPVSRMKLPRFGVDSAVEAIAYKAGTQNQLDTPHDPHNTGWYEIDGYGKPGFGGNSVFAAHVDYYPNILGPFNKLSLSEVGDTVVVTMGNGEEYRYQVFRVARFRVEEIRMGELIWPESCRVQGVVNGILPNGEPCKQDGAEWITLITCGGEFRKTNGQDYGEYLSRDVVVAQRIP